MSILNTWVDGDRAWIAVDTQTIHHLDGREFEFQKMIPLIHQNAVIAGRGTAAFLPTVFYHVAVSVLQFDDLVELMPQILRVAFADMIKGAAAAGIEVADDIEKETIVLIGWSNRHKRMVSVEYTQLDGLLGWTAQTVGPAYFSPWIEGMKAPDFSDPFNRDSMRQLAELQVRTIKEHAPGAAGGGRYIIAELSRDRMTIETICEL